MTIELVERARTGDHLAFEQLAAASIDRLYAIAHRVLRDAESAEDVVQECLVQAWRDIRALRDPERWDAWLYRLLLNACHDEQRRMRRRPTTVDINPIDPPSRDDELGRVDARDEIARGFLKLSVEHRMALTLHFYLGLRPAEIGTLLSIPAGTAESRLHYATRAMRAALEADLRATPSATGVHE